MIEIRVRCWFWISFLESVLEKERLNKTCARTTRDMRGEQQTTCWREWGMVGSEEGPAHLALQLHRNGKRCQLDKSRKDTVQCYGNREDIQWFPSVSCVRELSNAFKTYTVPSIGALALRLRSSCVTTQSQGANRNQKTKTRQRVEMVIEMSEIMENTVSKKPNDTQRDVHN